MLIKFNNWALEKFYRSMIVVILAAFLLSSIIFIPIMLFVPSYDTRAKTACAPMDYYSINGDIFCYTLSLDGSIDQIFPR